MIFSIFLVNPIKFRIGKKIGSQNLYIKYPIKGKKTNLIKNNNKHEDDHSLNILFIAHVDSKGQRFSIKVRILSYKLWVSSFFIGLIFMIIIDIFFF